MRRNIRGHIIGIHTTFPHTDQILESKEKANECNQCESTFNHENAEVDTPSTTRMCIVHITLKSLGEEKKG